MNRRQALGYALLAMEREWIKKEDIDRIVGEMIFLMDIYTPEEAEKEAFKYQEKKNNGFKHLSFHLVKKYP